MKAFTNPRNLELARTLYANKQTPIADIARQFGVSRATLYRYLGTKRVATKATATEEAAR